MKVGQGPIVFAVGVGGGCLDIFSLIYHFSFLPPSLCEMARYRLKYYLKRGVKPKIVPCHRHVFFSIPCGIENSCQKHHMHLKFFRIDLVKYINFPVLSGIRTRNFPDCKFVHVHLKCFSLKVHTCQVS